jgi:signal transduction histidine kinase
MNVSPAGAHTGGDITVRDLLSSLTALQVLSMVMTDSRGEDDILDLAVSALPSLSRHCRVEGVWLDGRWRSVGSLPGPVGPRAGLETQLMGLGSAGGALKVSYLSWAWAFPLSSRGGASGYIVVGSPESPPEHERSLIQALAQQTGAALANARLLARERTTRAQIADEQATLRRVATLVARAAPPEDVFTAVAAEAGRSREADIAVMSRYHEDGTATVVGAWVPSGSDQPIQVGVRLDDAEKSLHSLVFDTGQPARTDGYSDVPGPVADAARGYGLRSAVGVPIHIEGRLWGMIALASRHEEPLPSDTEPWLAGFTELVATAIANAQARVDLRGYAEEEAALRRVATLVARAAPPEQVFAAVTAEVGQVLSVDIAVLNRYDMDGTEIVLGAWSSSGTTPVAVGARVSLGGRNVTSLVFETGRPVRIDDYADVSGPIGDVARQAGIRTSVGVPISVGGRSWGVVIVASRSEPLPADIEKRLAGFTELVGTALANAEAQAALTASRARIVATADTARRRIGRDLHDGAQQRLVSLALQLRATKAAVPPGASDLAAELDGLANGLTEALDELREIASGIHPAALAEGGLLPALRMLARRSPVPVGLHSGVEGRLPEPIELAAYYVVAEALTNAAKHADASHVDVHVEISAGALRVAVRDDGRGGADAGRGSGLVGLRDRVETLGGVISLYSPPGAGTSLEIAIPLDGPRLETSPLPAGDQPDDVL